MAAVALFAGLAAGCGGGPGSSADSSTAPIPSANTSLGAIKARLADAGFAAKPITGAALRIHVGGGFDARAGLQIQGPGFSGFMYVIPNASDRARYAAAYQERGPVQVSNDEVFGAQPSSPDAATRLEEVVKSAQGLGP